MPFHTSLIDDGTGIFHRGEGVLLGSEIVLRLSSLAADHGAGVFAQVHHILVDLTAVTELKVTSTEVQLIVAASRAHPPFAQSIALAVVAPADYQYGMARMYEAYQSMPGWMVMSFRAVAEARAWLDAVVPARDGDT